MLAIVILAANRLGRERLGLKESENAEGKTN
jgi:hypothetical protein